MVQRRHFPTRIQWGLARLRPTMSIVLSEDELAWKWAALLVDGSHSGSNLLQASTSVCNGLFLSTEQSDVVSSPYSGQIQVALCWQCQIMFLYLRRHLSHRQVVVLLETFQAFSTVEPLTKNCQSNVADGLGVYKNRSDFCCGVLCCLYYLEEWILIFYRHVCLKYRWSGRLFRSSCVFVIRLSQFVSVRLQIRSASSRFKPSSTHTARPVETEHSSVNYWSNGWWFLIQRRIWNKSRRSCLPSVSLLYVAPRCFDICSF